MKSVMKFLLRSHVLTTIGSLALIGTSAAVLNLLFPGGFFASYYAGFPMMCVILLAVMSISLSGIYLNVALAMGARRRDFCVCVHLCVILEALLSLALIYGLYLFDTHFGLLPQFNSYFYTPDALWMTVFYLVCGQVIALGCMALGADHRRLGSVLTALMVMFLIFSYIFTVALADLELWSGQGIILAVLTVCTVLAEVFYLRYMKKATVK